MRQHPGEAVHEGYLGASTRTARQCRHLLSRGVEMDDLPAGVHPGVRATSDHQSRWVLESQDAVQARGQLTLDSAQPDLRGPAVEGRAVVGQVQP